MGRVVTPKYAVHYDVAGPYAMTAAGWKGRPTKVRLIEHVASLNASFQPGGVNAHAGPMRITGARIERNVRGGEVVVAITEQVIAGIRSFVERVLSEAK